MAYAKEIATLERALSRIQGLDFAALIGSRATGQAHADSDWDIAVQWREQPEDPLQALAHHETLRRHLARALAIDETRVDLVDLHRTNLAMRAAVADEGIPLLGEDDLPWMRFLARTWRDLEHWHLERHYAGSRCPSPPMTPSPPWPCTSTSTPRISRPGMP